MWWVRRCNVGFGSSPPVRSAHPRSIGSVLPIADETVDTTVLNPPAGDSGSDLHYNSITLAVGFGEFQYTTTGDAEAAAEERIAGAWTDGLDADVYHAGHHGSSTSSTAPVVDAVTLEMAVVSSAYDSQYGHPHDETLERFDELGIGTY